MSKDNLDKNDNKKKTTKGAKNSKKTDTKKKNTSTNKASSKRDIDTKTKAKKNNIEEKKEKDLEAVMVFDDEYDEDLEEFYDDDDEVEVVEVKKEDKKKEEERKRKEEEKKKQKEERDRIKKIEKMAKRNNKAKKEFDFSKLDNPELFHITLAFIIGAALATIVAFIVWPDRIATLKNGEQPIVKVAGKTYTADNLYKRMKDHYSVSQLLDQIDTDILTKKYPETAEMKKEVEATAENYINMYKQYYNYTEEQFLSANGFTSKDDYLDYLRLDNRRKKYEEDYVKDNLSDKEIEKYYKDNVYGDIKCEHVLVEVASEEESSSNEKSNKLKDADAKKLAQEIIDKINDGTSWKDIQKKYKDKVTYENLGYQSWDSDLETSFKDALKKMDNKSYSDEPVKTSYGYHVIYRETQKDTPSLKNTKDKIIEKLVDSKIKEDNNLLYKALISLRKDKKIKFSDTDMKEKYDTYVKQYNK
ncbi:MAG: peptidylprolyl isomerase [Bacilli bacterium]|nr:peptidylprolyl isomerase [Bacilli bacterium]